MEDGLTPDEVKTLEQDMERVRATKSAVGPKIEADQKMKRGLVNEAKDREADWPGIVDGYDAADALEEGRNGVVQCQGEYLVGVELKY